MDIKELNIEGERVFVKKSKIFGWGFVNPYKIDGKTNWKNVSIGGSWVKFWMMAIVLFIIYGVTQEYSTAVNAANECIKNLPIMLLP